jgi:hypothetical protein
VSYRLAAIMLNAAEPRQGYDEGCPRHALVSVAVPSAGQGEPIRHPESMSTCPFQEFDQAFSDALPGRAVTGLVYAYTAKAETMGRAQPLCTRTGRAECRRHP